MLNPLRIASATEQHLALKRWERMARDSGKRRSADSATPAPCLWRPDPESPARQRPARLLALYPEDLALVHFADVDGGIFLVRGGVPWGIWFARILRAYLHGFPVPAPFRPSRRLPAHWIEQAAAWAESSQAAWFAKLRETGLLPALSKLDAAGVAPLRWEEVRSRFLDFTGSPPPRS